MVEDIVVIGLFECGVLKVCLGKAREKWSTMKMMGVQVQAVINWGDGKELTIRGYKVVV
jgi:hypothetical protein